MLDHQMRFSPPSIKCSAPPLSFRLLPNTVSLFRTVHNDLITARSAVVGSWVESPKNWLTVTKNAFVGWALSFRDGMLLEGAVTQAKQKAVKLDQKGCLDILYFVLGYITAWEIKQHQIYFFTMCPIYTLKFIYITIIQLYTLFYGK